MPYIIMALQVFSEIVYYGAHACIFKTFGASYSVCDIGTCDPPSRNSFL
jgi:hypothetical protein